MASVLLRNKSSLVVFLLEHAKLDRADDSQKDITTRKIHDSSRTRAPTFVIAGGASYQRS